MKLLLPVLVLSFFFASPAFADTEETDAFFKAYYLEQGKHDLEAARTAYAAFIYRGSHRDRSLLLRAHIGLARIEARTGQGDPAFRLSRVQKLIEEIESRGFDDERDRVILNEAAKELAEARAILKRASLPDEAANAISKYIDLLRSEMTVGSQRSAIVKALTLFGEKAVPQLAEALRSPVPGLVVDAARVLVKVESEAAVEAMADALDDPEVLFPTGLADALENGTSAHAPVFMAAVSHPEPAVRLAGAQMLAQAFGRSETGLEPLEAALLEALEDKNPDVRRSAILTDLRKLSPASRVRALSLTLSDRDTGVAETARDRLRDLSGFGEPLPEVVVPDVLEMLRHENEGIRMEVLVLCRRHGGSLARQAVIRALDDESRDVRMRAAEIVSDGDVRPDEEVIAALVKGVRRVLTEEDDYYWQSTLKSMLSPIASWQGTDARVVEALVPVFRVIAEVPDGTRRRWAFGEAFRMAGQFDWRKTYPNSSLVESYAVLDRDEDRQAWLAEFSKKLGENAVPLAFEALEADGADLRRQAVLILGRELSPMDYAKTMLKHLDDPSAEIRGAAMLALGKLAGVEDRASAARKGLIDPNEDVRHAAIRPLVEAEGAQAFPDLIAAIEKDPDSWIAVEVVRAVSDTVAANEARDFLLGVLWRVKDQDARFRAAVWGAAERALTDEMVLEALKDGDAELFRRAAEIAGTRTLLDAWPLLLAREKTPEVERALHRIRTYHQGMKEYREVAESKARDATGKAEEMARSKEPVHRRAAALALAALGDRSAISVLLDLVKDEDEGVREAAMKALAKLAGGE